MSESVSIEHSGDRCQVSGVLDFNTAREALDGLQTLVSSSEQLHIDFSRVTRCNSAALAVLIELKAVARRQGHQVDFVEVPSGIRQLAQVCQVEGFI